jgi:hypothetical protein
MKLFTEKQIRVAFSTRNITKITVKPHSQIDGYETLRVPNEMYGVPVKT